MTNIGETNMENMETKVKGIRLDTMKDSALSLASSIQNYQDNADSSPMDWQGLYESLNADLSMLVGVFESL
jgi:hypothetical protein